MPFAGSACFRLDRIPVRPIRWLWRPYLACGKLALLDGDPGTGKSLLTADLAARHCARTLERAKRCLGVVARRVRKDGRAFWQWSNSTLPHGAGQCP